MVSWLKYDLFLQCKIGKRSNTYWGKNLLLLSEAWLLFFAAQGPHSSVHQTLIIPLSESQTDLRSRQNENLFQLPLMDSNGTFAE